MKACHESARHPDERYGPRRHKEFMHLEFVDLSDPLQVNGPLVHFIY
jgi:hypothetical protein